jgi:hypothetical protein
MSYLQIGGIVQTYLPPNPTHTEQVDACAEHIQAKAQSGDIRMQRIVKRRNVKEVADEK